MYRICLELHHGVPSNCYLCFVYEKALICRRNKCDVGQVCGCRVECPRVLQVNISLCWTPGRLTGDVERWVSRPPASWSLASLSYDKVYNLCKVGCKCNLTVWQTSKHAATTRQMRLSVLHEWTRSYAWVLSVSFRTLGLRRSPGLPIRATCPRYLVNGGPRQKATCMHAATTPPPYCFSSDTLVD